ncbi:hypothetical protein [Microbulbifer sp. PAAF003]|uniref:hypothetical protein n=1 Tax=Microbulbifer sp. PAAF003 TaxID=3243375 RepID=UPI0040398CAF
MDLNESLGEWLGELEAKQGFTLPFDMLSGKPHKDLVVQALKLTNLGTFHLISSMVDGMNAQKQSYTALFGNIGKRNMELRLLS